MLFPGPDAVIVEDTGKALVNHSSDSIRSLNHSFPFHLLTEFYKYVSEMCQYKECLSVEV